MIWIVTVTSYALWFTSVTVPIRPWTNWDDVLSPGRLAQLPCDVLVIRLKYSHPCNRHLHEALQPLRAAGITLRLENETGDGIISEYIPEE